MQDEAELKPIFHDPEKTADRRAALAVLASHLPILTAPGLVFGIATPARSVGDGVTEMGYFSLSPEAVAFMGDVYAYGWVREFDWMSWSHTLEGRCLLHDPTALEAVNEEGLARVLTVCMREAYWGSEALEYRFREGLLNRVMERAGALLRWDIQPGDLKIIPYAAAKDKPTSFLEIDRANWENLIAAVEDDALREHMQEALKEGNEDLLDTLVLEATFKS